MNNQNCVANQNCLVAVSFQHCNKETDGDINFDCKNNLPESKRNGREEVVRVMLQADMRYLFQIFHIEINISNIMNNVFFVKSHQYFDFIFNSRVATASNKGRFVALGVSEDNRMGNDLAFICQSFPSENETKQLARANTKVTYDFLEILITSFIEYE